MIRDRKFTFPVISGSSLVVVNKMITENLHDR